MCEELTHAAQELRTIAAALDIDLPSGAGYVERLEAVAHTIEEMKSPDNAALRNHLDNIEQKALSVAGYLAMLEKTRAIAPLFLQEATQQEDACAEMLMAVQEIKKLYGWPARYSIDEQPHTF